MPSPPEKHPAGPAAGPRTSGYLLLMRHGRRDRSSAGSERDQTLAPVGGEQAGEVAAALREICAGEGGVERITIGEVLHGHYRAAVETAEIVARALESPVPLSALDALDPESFRRAVEDGCRTVVLDLCGRLRGRGEENAVLAVGHQPQLGWIAEALTGTPEAVAGCEILCIEISRLRGGELPRRRDCRLLWALTPSAADTKALPELKEKIASKMKVAELLGVVIVGLLGWFIGKAFDREFLPYLQTSGALLALFGAALGALAVAFVLYVLTVFAYDELQMPERYWGESARRKPGGGWALRRPPSSAARVLHRNMIRAWSRLFVPATLALGAGLLLLAAATVVVARTPSPATDGAGAAARVDTVIRAPETGALFPLSGWTVSAAAAVALLAAVLCVYLWFTGRPRLGTQD
ncbi:MAG TPA: hypothetical protein VF746_25920 [Longimicrobium sp.]|jgi:phosphohistidine phosphatase SixA